MSASTRLAAISPCLLRGGTGRNLPLTERELVLDTLGGLSNWPRRLRFRLWRLRFGFRRIWSHWDRIWLRFWFRWVWSDWNRVRLWLGRIRLDRLRLRLWLWLSVVLSWLDRCLGRLWLSHNCGFFFLLKG